MGTWNPNATHARGYPKTLEAFEAQKAALRGHSEKARDEGKLTRAGVPNGFRQSKPLIETLLRNSRTEAEMLIEAIHPKAERLTKDEEHAAEAMECLVEIWRSPLSPPRYRLQAAHSFLHYNMAPPIAKQIMRAGNPDAMFDAMLREVSRSLKEPGEEE